MSLIDNDHSFLILCSAIFSIALCMLCLFSHLRGDRTICDDINKCIKKDNKVIQEIEEI